MGEVSQDLKWPKSLPKEVKDNRKFVLIVATFNRDDNAVQGMRTYTH